LVKKSVHSFFQQRYFFSFRPSPPPQNLWGSLLLPFAYRFFTNKLLLKISMRSIKYQDDGPFRPFFFARSVFSPPPPVSRNLISLHWEFFSLSPVREAAAHLFIFADFTVSFIPTPTATRIRANTSLSLDSLPIFYSDSLFSPFPSPPPWLLSM